MPESALDFPTSGEDGSTALLVGGGLVFLSGGLTLGSVLYPPFLLGALLCHLFVRGYYVRVLRVTAGDPNATAPAFDQWGDLLVDGMKALVIAVAFALPAVALVALAVGGRLVAVGGPSALLGTLQTLTGLTVLFLLVYLVTVGFLLPAAITSFALDGRLRAAVSPRVFSVALSEEYAFAWMVSLLFQVIAIPIAFLLQALIVGFFALFFVGVVTRFLWGRGFGSAIDFEPGNGASKPVS